MKQKILFVANDSGNLGSNKSTVNLICTLKKTGLNITLLIPEKGTIEEVLKSRNINYKIFKYYNWLKRKDDSYPKFKIFINIKYEKIIGNSSLERFCM